MSHDIHVSDKSELVRNILLDQRCDSCCVMSCNMSDIEHLALAYYRPAIWRSWLEVGIYLSTWGHGQQGLNGFLSPLIWGYFRS